MKNKNTIVSAQWLHDHLNNPKLILLDASLETTANGTRSEYEQFTIANARRFDLKNVFKDTSIDFPNTVPTPAYFEQQCRQLGINQDSEIVVFDHFGVYSSPRVWWLFNLMGHTNINVLDGGLPIWIKNGFKVIEKSHTETGFTIARDYPIGNFTANYQPELLITFDDIVENMNINAFTIVDARSKGRFDGMADDPRKHLQSGHIANSVNLPYSAVLNDDGKFKPISELTVLFTTICQANDNDDLVFSCGSGMTACIIMLAYEIFASDVGGHSSKKVYDGSWTEWATLNGLTK